MRGEVAEWFNWVHRNEGAWGD